MQGEMEEVRRERKRFCSRQAASRGQQRSRLASSLFHVSFHHRVSQRDGEEAIVSSNLDLVVFCRYLFFCLSCSCRVSLLYASSPRRETIENFERTINMIIMEGRTGVYMHKDRGYSRDKWRFLYLNYYKFISDRGK